jgi:predicted MFS family arabinose efflux permease
MAVLLFLSLPTYRSRGNDTYTRLLASLVTIFRQEPALRRAAAIQAALFASFSVCWTILALQLESRYRLGADIAGLFGLIGTVGVLIAPLAGRVADRRGPHLVIGLCSIVMLLSWVVFGLWESVAGLVAGVVLLDFGQQGALVSNQHIIYSIRPEARNRTNTIFMVLMFAGGAAGSAGASFAWQWGRWTYVSIFGALLSLLPLLIQLTNTAEPLTRTEAA